MSLFRKPKKPISRRVFSANDEEDANNTALGYGERLNVEDEEGNSARITPLQTASNLNNKKEKKKTKTYGQEDLPKTNKKLLSFVDDEEEGEVFQVKKSSHSKKVMRMLDRERRKKKAANKEKNITEYNQISSKRSNDNNSNEESNHNQKSSNRNEKDINSIISKNKNSNTVKMTDDIQTEIHTDDFVLVVKKSEPDNLILNGRAALCAGRDDMSSEDEGPSQETSTYGTSHRFAKPENFKLVLESGSIPDAAMIHAARKRRQKAREQGNVGDYIPIEDPKKEVIRKGNRLIREEGDDEASDEEERVDMNAITGIREREERREKFYAAENEYSGGESDIETNEWENQQIRKGVTGAQLVTAQQESMFSKFIIKSAPQIIDENQCHSTGTLLEQAYARNSLEKPRQVLLSTQKSENKPAGPRTPNEVVSALKKRLIHLKEINTKHKEEIQNIEEELYNIQEEKEICMQRAPAAASKYRFYQEIRGYVTDLVECLDEKAPLISELEKRTLNLISKHSNFLIERRRQDVRDQAKEMSESGKPGTSKKGPEYEAQVRRAAEREGRRTRRRCDREKTELISSHLDGMSSDDEIPDQDIAQYKSNLRQIESETVDIFEDTCEEYCKIDLILSKFDIWRQTDMESYKDAFVNLCLPKIVGQIIRVQMMVWNPLEEDYQDLEKMEWYNACMRYAYSKQETEESLAVDPDLRFVPTIIEKIVLPKLTEIIENCWDPLSSTKTLRLIGLIRRLGRDYPSLRASSKSLQTLFNTILDKMKTSLDNDVFIPIFPKQIQEAKSSFFQRQFCSGLKLFRNILSWQGLMADRPLVNLAIVSLLNRYLLSALRVCSFYDAVTKSYLIVNTLPTVWLQPESETLDTLKHFIAFMKNVFDQLDKKNPNHIQLYDRAKLILQKLHSYY